MMVIAFSLLGCQPLPETVTAAPVKTITQRVESTDTATPPSGRIIPIGQNGDWELIFSDEFDAETIDREKWVTCYWWDWEKKGCTNLATKELQWYQPDDVLIDNGELFLRAQRRTMLLNNGDIYQYTSGLVSTGRDTKDITAQAGLVFQYGYVEIKAKLPAGQGLWPAFWMLPDNNQSKPEIDILEVLGNSPNMLHMAFHYRTTGGEKVREKKVWQGPDFSADWHVFALDWQPDALIWYVDGVERWRYTDLEHIPSETMYLLINLAVGGEWPGDPDNTTPFPSFYEIDYVRVWKHQ